MSKVVGDKLDPDSCFRANRARVYRWAFAMCGRHDDALDVVQDVFLRLVERRPALRDNRATLAWLRRVTARIVIDRWRAAASRKASEQAFPPRSATEDSAESRELHGRIRDALVGLSAQQRLVLMGKCYDGMTFRQIADELGIAVPTAKTHYLRGLSAVRDSLRAHVEAGR